MLSHSTLQADQAVLETLRELQEELDKNPEKTLAEKNAGPSASDLWNRLKDTERIAADVNYAGVRQACSHLDAYLRNSANKAIKLADVICNVCTFDGVIRATAGSKKSLLTQLRAMRSACFTKTQAKTNTADFVPENRNGGRFQQIYTGFAIDIDVYLAKRGRLFEHVCRIEDNVELDAENKSRIREFFRMRDHFLRNAPTSSPLKGFFSILRAKLHKLPQDKVLEPCIDSATYDGAEIPAPTKKALVAAQRQITELLFEHGMNAETFLAGLKKFTRLEDFRNNEHPFGTSHPGINYAALAEKAPKPSTLDQCLRLLIDYQPAIQPLQNR